MNGKLFNAQYKEHFCSFREWNQLGHASEYLVYPENIGPHLSIDITNDRFHVQKVYYDAIDGLRVSLRWMARDLWNEEMRKCREEGIKYVPFRYANGDTRKQLLARAKYILAKHESKWTKAQRWRAGIIFEFYPELRRAYELAMELTDIFNRKCAKDVARTKLARWFNEVEKLAGNAFQTVIDTFVNHYDTILNFFVDRRTNAAAESFNAK